MEASTTTEEPLDDTRMTLGQHLEELRTRVTRSVIALVVIFIVAWIFHKELMAITLEPYVRATTMLKPLWIEHCRAIVAGSTEITWPEYFTSAEMEKLIPAREIRQTPRSDGASMGFYNYMRVCMYFAIFLGGPYLLWQMWQFIAAGLYKDEKCIIHTYFPFSVLLFVGGVVFGYYLLVPYALYFLAKAGLDQFEYWETIDTYFGFLRTLTLALGLVFQLPVVMLALSRIGLVEPKLYATYRPHCIVGALIVAAILTPPDPYTQMLMAGPIIVLYELGYQIARFAVKKQEALVP